MPEIVTEKAIQGMETKQSQLELDLNIVYKREISDMEEKEVKKVLKSMAILRLNDYDIQGVMEIVGRRVPDLDKHLGRLRG